VGLNAPEVAGDLHQLKFRIPEHYLQIPEAPFVVRARLSDLGLGGGRLGADDGPRCRNGHDSNLTFSVRGPSI
jgi:hypothetical protein